MRYGEDGDRFYLILRGKVSIWVPVPHEHMKEPLAKFKKVVQKEVDALEFYHKNKFEKAFDKLVGLDFRRVAQSPLLKIFVRRYGFKRDPVGRANQLRCRIEEDKSH